MAERETNAAAGAAGTARCDVRTAKRAVPTIYALRTPNDREQAAHTTAKRTAAFTLTELVVTVGVLVLLVFLATQLINSAATVTTAGHKQMDADSQTRQVLDRMAIDFVQMVKRSDVADGGAQLAATWQR
jgi:hypothetical protein